MERLDNILKSVATSSTKVSVASASAVVLPNGDTKAGVIKQEPLTVTSETVPGRARSVSGPSRKPSLPSLQQPPWDPDRGLSGGHNNGGHPEAEEDRRKQRRERNKEAAARCRKRRLDLTCTLQVNILSFDVE